MIIKLLLIAGVLLIGLLAFRDRPTASSLAVRRLAGIAIALVGTLLVIWPDITTWAADLVGVGRGTDLLFYLCILLFMYVAIAQAQRAGRLEERLDALTREIALLETGGREAEHGPT